MVNKREKNLPSDKLLSFFLSFIFIPFLLLFSSFFPYHFCFKFIVSQRNVHSSLPTYLGGIFFPLLGVSERNFFSGGVHVHPVHPPAYAPGLVLSWKNTTE